MNKLIAIAALSGLALTACGSDDDGGGGGDGARDEIYAQLTQDGTEGWDESCLREKIDELSSEDAEFIAANIDAEDVPDGASEGAIAFVTSIFECFDLSDIDLDDIDLGDLESE